MNRDKLIDMIFMPVVCLITLINEKLRPNYYEVYDEWDAREQYEKRKQMTKKSKHAKKPKINKEDMKNAAEEFSNSMKVN
ncbi:hypothetical protein [Methanosarcina sp.]|uniref:hypothetical protein n=1 Tax=Methanosarcina sp. TaxID=2213 RepID=UPI002B9D82CE|nr:hypothetical protein [Methanosarcina sp.]HOW15054.1 hypothetical protein [Methanosarcina sp.]